MFVPYWRELVLACHRFFDALVEHFIIVCMLFLSVKNKIVSVR